jgi:hypothetical protein
MLIDLQQRNADNHTWELVATFRYAHMAIEAAVAFSKLDRGTYRVLDKRFHTEGDQITIITNGHITQPEGTPT